MYIYIYIIKKTELDTSKASRKILIERFEKNMFDFLLVSKPFLDISIQENTSILTGDDIYNWSMKMKREICLMTK